MSESTEFNNWKIFINWQMMDKSSEIKIRSRNTLLQYNWILKSSWLPHFKKKVVGLLFQPSRDSDCRSLMHWADQVLAIRTKSSKAP